jgi:hypothetical protein
LAVQGYCDVSSAVQGYRDVASAVQGYCDVSSAVQGYRDVASAVQDDVMPNSHIGWFFGVHIAKPMGKGGGKGKLITYLWDISGSVTQGKRAPDFFPLYNEKC